MTAVFDTGTMGDNHISGKFLSTFQIHTQDLDIPISPKMAVKASRSTINHKSQPLIQVADETGATTDALVCSLDNDDIVLGITYFTAHNAIVDCGNAIMIFPKKGVTHTCKKANNRRFSAMTNSIPLTSLQNSLKYFLPRGFRNYRPCARLTITLT